MSSVIINRINYCRKYFVKTACLNSVLEMTFSSLQFQKKNVKNEIANIDVNVFFIRVVTCLAKRIMGVDNR